MQSERECFASREEEAFQKGTAVNCSRKPLACQLACQPEDFKGEREQIPPPPPPSLLLNLKKKKEISNHRETLILKVCH